MSIRAEAYYQSEELVLLRSIEALRALAPETVQCAVTSPPYWRLRTYGDAPNELGREDTPGLYVERLVDHLRMVRDTLTSGGTLWLNLGTTYRHKQDMQIPARVSLALQDDGWIVRADVIWWKPNAPPSSVRDRPGVDYEHLYMLTKSPTYLYNREAVMEPAAWDRWGKQTVPKYVGSKTATGWMEEKSKEQIQELGNGRKNLRSVWRIPTSNNATAHWAPFPAEIPRRCILASSNPGDFVLDPYCGSGTTLAEAIKLRRRAVGVDIYEDALALSRGVVETTPLTLDVGDA
jgi:DNA modification methylase